MLCIIQNDTEVPCGNLADLLTGVPAMLCRPYAGEQLPAVGEISGMVVLGGAMGANDDAKHPFLSELKLLIHEVVVAGIPYLGICLGGQLLAAALGARVVSNRWEELGILAVHLTEAGQHDPLFAGVSAPFTTFQWHHDSFDLPDGATLLATSAVCPHQAFRVGANAWGLQFHPEVSEQIIRDWCAWDPITACQVERLVDSFAMQEPAYRHVAARMFTNFLGLPCLL